MNRLPLNGYTPLFFDDGQLEARDIHLDRHGHRILQEINLQAHPGRVLALVGPNGAGKSSLLGVLAGLIAPSAGDVRLAELPLAQWPMAKLARRRAMLSQNVQLGFAFRVEEVVMLGRTPHAHRATSGQDMAIVQSVMQIVQVSHLRGRNCLELSGGEQRRVQLARVLAQIWDREDGPAWLLLDEPEAGLDMAHQRNMLRQMRVLSHQGFGIIIVLHDLNLAAHYADDIALMAHGRLVSLGEPEHVMDPLELSRVYGVAMHRLSLSDGTWVLVPR